MCDESEENQRQKENQYDRSRVNKENSGSRGWQWNKDQNESGIIVY
jgi:hypothetical protein